MMRDALLRLKLLVLILLAAFQIVVLLNGNSKAVPLGEREVQLSEQDTLKFLVRESDLIVIVDIQLANVIDKIKRGVGLSSAVDAHVVTVVSGREANINIKIEAETKFPDKGSLVTFVNFKEGKNLIFLSKDGEEYRPTTGSSVLDVWKSRVYPVWDYKDGYGTELKQVIKEIESMKALLEREERGLP
jgi:hypothetical protein